MSCAATIELRDLQLTTRIGTYGPNDVVPDAHTLDLTLTISSDLVLVGSDDMALVFDYDPLIAQIDEVSQARHYQTQERLMTLIVEICARYPQVLAIEIYLRKTPVLLSAGLAGTGELGVRLLVSPTALADIRSSLAS